MSDEKLTESWTDGKSGITHTESTSESGRVTKSESWQDKGGTTHTREYNEDHVDYGDTSGYRSYEKPSGDELHPAIAFLILFGIATVIVFVLLLIFTDVVQKTVKDVSGVFKSVGSQKTEESQATNFTASQTEERKKAMPLPVVVGWLGYRDQDRWYWGVYFCIDEINDVSAELTSAQLEIWPNTRRGKGPLPSSYGPPQSFFSWNLPSAIVISAGQRSERLLNKFCSVVSLEEYEMFNMDVYWVELTFFGVDANGNKISIRLFTEAGAGRKKENEVEIDDSEAFALSQSPVSLTSSAGNIRQYSTMELLESSERLNDRKEASLCVCDGLDNVGITRTNNDLSGDGVEEACVSYAIDFCDGINRGSESSTVFCIVYAMRNGDPVKIFQKYGECKCVGGVVIVSSTNREYRHEGGYTEVTQIRTYKLLGSEFELVSSKIHRD